MTPALLTPALQERIVASLRAGGFPEIAAQAWGVAPRTFRRWLRRGDRGIEPYRGFAAAVREAIAQARLRAEMEIFENQPRIWLQHGPGRETETSVGWTTAVKPSASRGKSGSFDEKLVGPLLAKVHDSLRPFPEASECVSANFAGEMGCRNRDSKRKRREP
jgi:hypothetical protein